MRETTNQLLVLQALHARPASSRPELIRLTGLSRPTVSALVDQLLAHGLLEERAAEPGAPARPATGRPPRLLTLAPRAGYAIGLEFGRDHVGWVICDLAGRALAEGHEAIAIRMPSAQSIDVIAARVQGALGAAGIAREAVLGVGVAIAAPIERPAGTLHADDLLPGWGDEPPQPAIEARLGLPVVVENDANAGAIGERTFGAAAGVDDLIYVRLSTGVGAGLIVGGSIYTGGSGMAGEIGHVTVVEDGPICRCGNRGCLEAVAGPPVVAGLLSAAVGEPVSVPRMLELVAAGHRGALRAIDDAGALAGRAIAATVNVLNPRMVVVGGELAGAGAPLLDAVGRAVRRHASPPIASTVEVRAGTLGEQAEVLGAAALILADAPQRLSERIGRRGAPSAAFDAESLSRG